MNAVKSNGFIFGFCESNHPNHLMFLTTFSQFCCSYDAISILLFVPLVQQLVQIYQWTFLFWYHAMLWKFETLIPKYAIQFHDIICCHFVSIDKLLNTSLNTESSQILTKVNANTIYSIFSYFYPHHCSWLNVFSINRKIYGYEYFGQDNWHFLLPRQP